MRLVRVSQDFRVIALGLPSPPYQGHPLDPPLRSRFQARDVSSLPFKVRILFFLVYVSFSSMDISLLGGGKRKF